MNIEKNKIIEKAKKDGWSIIFGEPSVEDYEMSVWDPNGVKRFEKRIKHTAEIPDEVIDILLKTSTSKDEQNVVATKWISHAEILKLIGEIDGICLESKENCIVVYLEVCGQKIEIIRDCATNIYHNITRLGIANELARKLKNKD